MKNPILRKTMLSLLLLATACLSYGCADDDTEQSSMLASKITLTLNKYYNERGDIRIPLWEASDRAAIRVEGMDGVAYAPPIQPGLQKSLFLFNFEARRDADLRIVGSYPADADVRYADGALLTTVPAAQTGSIVPCMAGTTVGRANTYEGLELELGQCYCTLFVSVPQGDYAISRAVVTANGGEAIAGEVTIPLDGGGATASERSVTVTLPQPLDCRGGPQLVPVMLAPVKLSQGYSIMLTDTDGSNQSIRSNDPVELVAGEKIETNATPSRSILLGTYNLWVTGSGTGAYEWNSRRSILAQSIVENGWDIFGFQEANATIQQQLPALVEGLGRKYEWWFVGRDAQDGTSGEAIGIAYNSERFELADKHFFWISPTPDELSYGWDETNYYRIAACATVTDKILGKRFFMMVTHSPLAETARNEGAQLLIEREKMYNMENLPSILVGDMNAHMDEPSARTLRTHWSDTFLSISPGLRSGPVGTFNNHDTGKDLTVSKARIDYIYHRGDELEITSYRCDDTTYKGIYPSDHCPVTIHMYLDSKDRVRP